MNEEESWMVGQQTGCLENTDLENTDLENTDLENTDLAIQNES